VSRVASLLVLALLGGCSTKDSTMTTNQRWANSHTLIGWVVELDGQSDAVRNAHLKRHPRHSSYIPHVDVKPLSESEANEYDRLNAKMHEEIRRVSKEHFADTPPPSDVDPHHWLAEYFTPFTYQNTDWYGPSYECYVCVRTDYISADLLRKFQSLLIGEFKDWCIQVVASNTPEFANDHEIAVFSDQIIVPSRAAVAIGYSSVGR
jgi:hypothetical protein